MTVSAVKSALTENQSIRTINFGAHTLAFNLIQVPDELVGKRASKASDKIADKDIFAVIHDNFDISLTIKEDVILQKNDMLITVTIMD